MAVSVQSKLAAKVAEAYGGEERWRLAEAVDARITMGGLLLKLKGHPESSLADMRTHTEIGRPYVRVEPIDDRGNIGILEGHDVRFETPDGRVVEERRAIRSGFPVKGFRWLHWDRLDAFYFVGYTQWIYNAFPALLWRDDIEWAEVGDATLEAHFPPELPTHSAVQQYHFDDAGRIRQMDYTAEVFGSWAKAAHVVEEHRETDGIPWPSRRRVWARRPDGSPRISHQPLMVKLDVHEWRLV
jgi:hypothetical protein